MQNTIEFYKTVESFTYEGYLIEKFYTPKENKNGKVLPIRTVRVLKNAQDERLFNCYKKARQYIRQKKNDTFGSIEAYKNPYKAVKPIIYRENY